MTSVNEEIARRELTNEDAAREIGVPERSLRRWRRREVEPRRQARHLLTEWLEKKASTA